MVQFEADPRFNVEIGTTEGETILAINNGRPPLDDVRVRRAIAHAIDRSAIIEGAMFGYGTPIGSHFAPHHPAYADLTDMYPHDPEKAKALLAEAGHGDGLALTLQASAALLCAPRRRDHRSPACQDRHRCRDSTGGVGAMAGAGLQRQGL